MAKRRSKRPKVSDQIRQLIDTSGMTKYRLALLTGIEQSSMTRFMSGERGLSTKALDRIGEVLDLEMVMHGAKDS